MIDLATLTGAIDVALGSGAAAVFTRNSSPLWDKLHDIVVLSVKSLLITCVGWTDIQLASFNPSQTLHECSQLFCICWMLTLMSKILDVQLEVYILLYN